MSKRHNSRQSARRRRSSAHYSAPSSLYRRTLHYEPLEDRRLLAVVTVDTLSDTTNFNDGLTTLREAIFAANTVPGADTIDFSPSLTASGPAKIVLTQGEIKITDSLTISGPGASLLTIDASGSDPTPTLINGDGTRIFNMDDGTSTVMNVSIAGLTLTGGQTSMDGGAILTRESLTIANTTINKNYSFSSNALGGGGIAAFLADGANLTISQSIVSNNQATAIGGGISLNVAANSTVRIDDTQVSGNSLRQQNTFDAGGGVYIVDGGGTLTIRDSGIHDNSSPGSGGGISFGGSLTIERTSIANNSASVSGGGIQFRSSTSGGLTLTDSKVLNNEAAYGGGIALLAPNSLASMASHTITRCEIANNEAHFSASINNGLGGGIYVEPGSLHVVDSSIHENSASKSGGGLYIASSVSASGILMEGSTVFHNTAALAGGGLDLNRSGVIRQSTITGNSATTGGGLYISANTTVYQSTVTENVASSIAGAVYVKAGTLSSDHSILANNSGLVTVGDLARGTTGVVSAFYSLIGHNNGSGLAEAPVGIQDASGNLIGGSIHGEIDPLLRPLSDYGGLTLTHAPAPGSPAINGGNQVAAAGVNGVPLYDQRGEPFNRVIDGRIDIGAVEFHAPPGSDLIVDILADESDGNYAPGDLSLREAIQLANLVPDANSIHFSPTLTVGGPATILLTRGDLSILSDASIVGPGASLLTINASRNDPTPDTNDGLGSGIFDIGDGTDDFLDVSLFGLSLTGGDSQYGGAVLSTENLTITGCTISGNYATELGGGVVGIYGIVQISDCIITDNATGASGGGIAATAAELVVENSIVSGNAAHAGGGIHAYDTQLSIINSRVENNAGQGFISVGGGVFHKAGKLTVANSTISGNAAEIGGGIYSADDAEIAGSIVGGNSANRSGGGLYAFGQLEVRETTISGNSASIDGGGIRSRGVILIDSSTLAGNSAGRSGGGMWIELEDGTATIVNTTISGNSSHDFGGGAWLSGNDTTTTIAHSTIYENSTTAPVSLGGGVFLFAGSLTFDHTMVAKNSALVGPDFIGQEGSHVSARYSLIGSNANSGFTEAPVGMPDANGNFIGGPIHGAIDSLLGPLADYGGPTFTHAPLPGSPAINAGDLNAVAGVDDVPQYDQRGTPFGRVFNGRIDIGAFEYQQPSDLNLLVDTLVDESDGNYSRGDLSLREAILLANTYAGPIYASVVDTIRFDPLLVTNGPATIVLTQGELKITDSLTIAGPGASLLTVDASGSDPTPEQNNRDGSRVFNIDDGKFNSASDVTLVGLTLTGGDVSTGGGAITFSENLRLIDSAVIGNSAVTGGGIYRANSSGIGGSLTITRSVIQNNSASGRGGGVFWRADANTLTILDSQFLSNIAGTDGGGLFFTGFRSQVVVTDSVFSNNAAGEDGGGMIVTRAITTIIRTSVLDNYAGRGGGGIAADNLIVSDSSIIGNSANSGYATVGANGGGGISAGTFVVTSTIISGNSSKSIGGGIFGRGTATIADCIITGNSATVSGGGIHFGIGNLIVTNSAIRSNSASGGGGIASNGGLVVTNSAISGNSANGIAQISSYRNGGGVWCNGSLLVSGTTISSNSSKYDGGGIWAGLDANVTITSSTVSGNSAGAGGGLWVTGGASISHSTIASNSAQILGGGLFAQSGTLQLQNSIVAQNSAPAGRNATGLIGTTIIPRYSLIGWNAESGLVEAPVGSPDANGNLIGGPVHGAILPMLAPLADNGGITLPDGSHIFTHALLTSSPAINAGDPATIAGVNGIPLYDQRGMPFTRVYGGRIDIGALESQPSDHDLGDFNRDGVVDAADYVLWRKQSGLTVTPGTGADGNGDGQIDNADYLIWRANFGQSRIAAGASSGEQARGIVMESLPVFGSATPTNDDSHAHVGAQQFQLTPKEPLATRPRPLAARKLVPVERAPDGLLVCRAENSREAKAPQPSIDRRENDRLGAESVGPFGDVTAALDEAFATLVARRHTWHRG